MRATTALKAGQLTTIVGAINARAARWRSEHFANGEHNSHSVPATVIEVSSAGGTVAETSITADGATYSATVTKLGTGHYSIDVDAGVVVETASAAVIHTASSQAIVDAVSSTTVHVRTHTVDSAGARVATDLGFLCVIYAAKFSDDVPAALATAFAPGDFPEATKVVELATASDAVRDLMLVRHGREGVHTDRRNPLAVGRISYTGGVYVVEEGSIGVVSATKLAAGRVAVEFAATAPTHWLARVTPIGAAAYPYTSARTTTGVGVELFSTVAKPVYALRDGDFFIEGWAL